MSYEIGYRKPPISGRFKEGTSGNPLGRPKGSKNILTIYDEEIEKSVVIVENGRKRKVSKRQAVIMRIIAGAASGDPKMIAIMLDLERRYGFQALESFEAQKKESAERHHDAIAKAMVLIEKVHAQRLAEAPSQQPDFAGVELP